MNFNDIISEIMYLVNNTIDELYYFVPSLLRIIALTLFIIMVNFALKKQPTKSKKILIVVINVFFGVYSFLRLVPLDNFDFNLEFGNWSEILLLIMGFIPYISMLILGKIIKGKKIVQFFLSYHMVHLLFLLIAIIWNYFDESSVSLVATLVYTIFTYTFSFANYKSGGK